MFSGCGTATAAAILTVVENGDVPYVFPYAGLDKLIDPVKKNVYSLVPLYSDQMTAIVPFILSKSPAKTAVMESVNIAGHEGWRKAAREKLEAGGVTVQLDLLVDITAADRSPFVLQIKEKKSGPVAADGCGTGRRALRRRNGAAELEAEDGDQALRR